jgi:hypothetical protein
MHVKEFLLFIFIIIVTKNITALETSIMHIVDGVVAALKLARSTKINRGNSLKEIRDAQAALRSLLWPVFHASFPLLAIWAKVQPQLCPS